jgi:citrate synthase
MEDTMAGEVRYKNIGLRGVTVADTKISYIDGENGVLIYRGFRIEDLVEKSTFPETAFTLLNGPLPGREELQQFEQKLNAERQIPQFILDSFKEWPKDSDPMDVLQASVPLLGMADPDIHDETRGASIRMAIRLIARIPAIMAAWHRIRNGLDPLPSDAGLSHAANFLWQLTGNKPDEDVARDLDVCLILHADHTFNASTFACREVVSTQAHMYAGVAAGVGALSGNLHGGANARVMEMLFEVEKMVKSEDEVGGWVRTRLDKGQKIMGMGHAVYKTVDPRSRVLKKMSERLGKKTGRENWYRLLTRIEEESLREFEKRGKSNIKSNVDFYSGFVYFMMGIPVDLMTPVFAISRIAGWCAHILEERFAEAQGKPALYRPQAEYVGDYCGPVGCVYQPREER